MDEDAHTAALNTMYIKQRLSDDAISHIDLLLLGNEAFRKKVRLASSLRHAQLSVICSPYRQLMDAHIVRDLGCWDFDYMLDIGLRQADFMAASLWNASFYTPHLRKKSADEGFWSTGPPFDPIAIFPIDYTAEPAVYYLKQTHPFVETFLARCEGG